MGFLVHHRKINFTPWEFERGRNYLHGLFQTFAINRNSQIGVAREQDFDCLPQPLWKDFSFEFEISLDGIYVCASPVQRMKEQALLQRRKRKNVNKRWKRSFYLFNLPKRQSEQRKI